MGKNATNKDAAIAPDSSTFALFTVIVLRWKNGLVTAMQRSTAIKVAKNAEQSVENRKTNPWKSQSFFPPTHSPLMWNNQDGTQKNVMEIKSMHDNPSTKTLGLSGCSWSSLAEERMANVLAMIPVIGIMYKIISTDNLESSFVEFPVIVFNLMPYSFVLGCCERAAFFCAYSRLFVPAFLPYVEKRSLYARNIKVFFSQFISLSYPLCLPIQILIGLILVAQLSSVWVVLTLEAVKCSSKLFTIFIEVWYSFDQNEFKIFQLLSNR